MSNASTLDERRLAEAVLRERQAAEQARRATDVWLVARAQLTNLRNAAQEVRSDGQ